MRFAQLLAGVLLALVPLARAEAEIKWAPWSPVVLESGAADSHTFKNEDNAPYRFTIEIIGGGSPSTASLEIKDADNAILLAKHDLADRLKGSMFLTDMLFVPKVTLHLKTNGSAAASVRIAALLRDDSAGGGLGPGNNWQETVKFSENAKVVAASKAVVRLIFPGVTNLSPTCTGFVFSRPDVIVTDRHCIEASFVFNTSLLEGWRPCGDVTIQFGYLKRTEPSPTTKAKCEMAVKSFAQDLALLRVSYPSGNVPTEIIRPADGPLVDQEKLFVVHHPLGLPQKISQCFWGSDDDPGEPFNRSFIRYRCPTAPGSSGGPVLNANGQLVGVHFWSEADTATTFQSFYDALRRGEELMNRATLQAHVASLLSALPN